MLRAFIAITLAYAPVARAADALPQPSATHAREARFYRPELPHAQPATTPGRIVSLAPVVTETLFALGAGEHVVGVTRFCDRPATAAALPKVGGYVDPSLERILALRPDLVISMPSFGQREVLDRVREAGVPVLVVFADTLDEVGALPSAIGDAVGFEKRGAELGEQFLARQLTLRLSGISIHGPPKKRVLVVVGVDPIVVAGPGTFADEIVTLVGATSVARRDGPAWPQWSVEAVLQARPDVIVAAEGPAAATRLRAMLPGVDVRAAREMILMRPGVTLLDDADALRALLARETPVAPRVVPPTPPPLNPPPVTP